MPKMTGAQVMAEMLKGYGVTHTFLVPAVLRRSMAEMEERTNIARIQTHGEKSAAYMADGYARAGKKPGVCMAQVIGALNLAAGLKGRLSGESPRARLHGRARARDEVPQGVSRSGRRPAFEPVTKFNATVDDASRFPDMLRQAFRVAMSGCPGPVHLQFAGNEGQLDIEEAEMEVIIEEDFKELPPTGPNPKWRG